MNGNNSLIEVSLYQIKVCINKKADIRKIKLENSKKKRHLKKLWYSQDSD